MTSRNEVLNALNHLSGPVPVDLGATALTGMHCAAVSALRDYYGMGKRPVENIVAMIDAVKAFNGQ